MARRDERLGASLIRERWISRTHVLDACASLGLQGALMPLEDLVRHDAAMDLRAPIHDLTRAHAVLRTRRSIAAAEPSWATSPAGLADLSRGRTGEGRRRFGRWNRRGFTSRAEEKAGEGACDDDAFAAELAAIDAVLERSSRALAGAVPPRAQDPLALVYDLDWDEGARLQQWLGVAEDTRALPPLPRGRARLRRVGHDRAAAAPALARGAGGFGAAAGAGRGTPASALPECSGCASCRMTAGARGISRHRLAAFLEAVRLGAGQGIKDHDRWRLSAGCARTQALRARNCTRSCQPSLILCWRGRWCWPA